MAWTVDLNIKMSIEEIGEKSDYSFRRLVKIRGKEYALEYLLKLKSKHSKMENLDYLELKMKNYFSEGQITVQEARNLFRFRRRVANFQENMKNNQELSIAVPGRAGHPAA